jgi:hemolysin activation/secretion protein
MCKIVKVMLILAIFFCAGTLVSMAEEAVDVNSVSAEQKDIKTKIEEKAKAAEQMEEMREAAAREKREQIKQAKRAAAEKRKGKQLAEIEQLTLPVDDNPRLKVKEIRISGNTLVPTEDLLNNMPLVYNSSSLPLKKAESEALYDLRIIDEIYSLPGETRDVSTRTIQGFVQYILSAYQEKNYGGIYVYVPREALKDGVTLVDQILPIKVIEAAATSVRITAYDVNQTEREKPILRRELIEEWSPVRANEVVNKKELDDFVNLLNLNPDRYVSATISKGAEPNSLAVGYDVYETSPWHYYIQVDNAGTKDRRWRPRLGLINTNLTGRDDRLTIMAQISPEKNFEDNYAYYGSYEFPLWSPRLRLTLYGGRSEFDISAVGGIGFIGTGSFYGGLLRYNLFQKDSWFFDLTAGVSHEESKISPQAIPLLVSVLKQDLKWDLWSVGFDIHRRDDMSNSSITFNRQASYNQSSKSRFNTARAGAHPDFRIYTLSANHSQYLDPDKIERLSGNFRWIDASGRLVPAKMTTFGGLYTVRGYREDQIVADEGMLYSVQYEFDLIAYNEAENHMNDNEMGQNMVAEEEKEPWLRKLAPVAFIDGGRAKIVHPVAGESGTEELLGAGVGLIGEVGENFEAAAYLAWPLRDAGRSQAGQERLHLSFIARW